MLPESGMFGAEEPGVKASFKLLPLTLFAIAVASLSYVQPAQANYILTLQQVGSNVVATGSGAIDLTGLTFEVTTTESGGFVCPSLGTIFTGTTSLADVDEYIGISSTTFGSGVGTFADSGSGDRVGISGALFVPHGYMSGAALSSSMTFNNATFASLGVTPSTFVWTWGSGPNQNFTLIIEGAGVPDGGSTVSLLGCALLGLAALRRKLSC
jgi:hypothetical protein